MSDAEFYARIEVVLGPLDGRHVVVMTNIETEGRQQVARAWVEHFNDATAHIEVPDTEVRAARLIPLLVFVSDISEIEHLPESAMNQYGWYKHPVHNPGFTMPGVE